MLSQSRLESVFSGRPYDLLDAALNDTVATFPVDIQVSQAELARIFGAQVVLWSRFSSGLYGVVEVIYFHVCVSKVESSAVTKHLAHATRPSVNWSRR